METALAAAIALIVGIAVGAVARSVWTRRAAAASGSGLDVIHDRFDRIGESVDRLADLVRYTGGADQAKLGELAATLRSVDSQTSALTNILGNSRLRGQWGERSAEDILRAAGFTEGAGYHKQLSVNGSDGSRTRPDFVFPLPRGMSVRMDVKFPLDNYARAAEAAADADRDRFEKAFVRDVRDRIKEIASRDYVDPAAGTVDYVLMFIPSESVYTAVYTLDPTLVDGALGQRVICCSPMTLFGVLAVIRKAVESFQLQQASDEVVALMGQFTTEWGKFATSIETLDRRLASARTAFDDLSGPRRRMLERSLDRIDNVRRERGLPSAETSPTDAAQDKDSIGELIPVADGTRFD
jgi:DNA recombination protein RmuC